MRGLYAITPDEADVEALALKVRGAIAGGASVVQYRNKSADYTLRRKQGATILALCRASHVPLIINDDLDLAVVLGADGLHLGKADESLAAARSLLGPGRILGASCYDRLDLADAARRAGADYVAFGSAFASSTKRGAVRAPLSIYREAKVRFACPIVAVGGITIQNARRLIEAGADALAVISDLFDASDIEQRAREFASIFDSHDFEKRPAV